MKPRILLALILLHAGSLTGSARGQEPKDRSFIATGTVWKKHAVLRASINVEQIHFCPDGRVAVLAGHKGVSVWDWKTERELCYFSFPKGTHLSCLAVTADGKRLASAHLDTTRVLVWDLDEGVEVSQLDHGAPVHALAFSRDGKHLASGGGHLPEEKAGPDHFVHLWNLADAKPSKRFLGPDRPVRTIALDTDSIIAEDSRGETFIWRRNSGEVERRISTHSFVTPLGFIGDGRKLVGYEVGAGRFLSQWDSALGKKERLIDMSPMSQPAKHGFWSNADGSRAATSHSGELVVWDLQAKAQFCVLIIPRENEVLALAFTPDSSEVVVAFSNKTVVRMPVEKSR